ncbi:pyrroline-5-carboxylate reductase [[Clostridium] polysaccharolyticum]|uniref:Pyrroline-5-carboxylate reductase n=1 Tax=[Clostridium] polysaccharolyticum TaxID=29364 RepID=A0A1I0AD54_9FIRM|nr:pyrroline-5-carboxylate reductase [[Clostridium] polysaccharolyticum]SES91688.1 pyrroline-5-carboxylate reductase [[Clostridium] polysaccharolyticum]
MAVLGFIGIGNMGYAMMKGALTKYTKEELAFTSVDEARNQQVAAETGVSCIAGNIELVKSCKYVVLAIKPQVYPLVLKEIKDYITKDHVMISIAPGITTGDVAEQLGGNVKVSRAMPNTPALVNEGMAGLCFGSETMSEEEKNTVIEFFGSFGKCEVIDEKLMNAVVCASGSSPAYVYMFIEALADSAVKYGIPRDKAYAFAAQTVLGSAKMVLETGEHPGKLKDNVCSPGGTTIAAVEALEEYGFRNAIMKATDACYEKTAGFKK